MLKYVKKYWFWCFLSSFLMVLEICIDLLQPDMMAEIIDEGVLKYNLPLVFDVGLEMIILVMLGVIFGILSAYAANIAAQGLGDDMRRDLFKRIMNLAFEQTDKFSTGSLITRLSNDVNQVLEMVRMTIRGFVRNTIMLGGGIYMLYLQSPKFAFVAACGLPFIVSFILFFLKKATPMFALVQKKLDGINNIMQEVVAGSRVIKAYVKEDFELKRFGRSNEELCQTQLKVQSLLAFMPPCMNIILNLCVVGVIFVGGIEIQNNGDITIGQIMAAITYLAMILHGITFMANIFQTFTRAKASWARIAEVLNSENVLEDGNTELENEKIGEIEFRNVDFGYPGVGDKKVLNDISLHIKKGETFGIIGTTGSGKSSLVNLIPRFYDVTDGKILINGVNIKEYKLSDLRKKIAIVLQKPELYSRSIEENIRWGKNDASFVEIKTAAEIAQADDFITATEDGYDTQVTEGGHSLSGGQKQRISLSRAVIKGADILIFDDATSALDLKTEAAFYRALRKQLQDTTKIIVAQRIASIKNAEQIAVLHDGRITAIGTHEELLEKSDIYLEIYNSQLNGGGVVEE